MVPRGLSKRYATALFNSAIKSGKEKALRDEAMGFRQLLLDNKAFRNFLLSPQVLTRDKKDIIKSTLNKSSDLLVRFLLLIIDKKRFILVEDIIEAYNYLVEHHEGILEVRAITAIELDPVLERKVIGKLERETSKTIRLKPEVDPSIIGGMILIMEDKIIDGSIRYSLEKLRRDLDAIRIA